MYSEYIPLVCSLPDFGLGAVFGGSWGSTYNEYIPLVCSLPGFGLGAVFGGGLGLAGGDGFGFNSEIDMVYLISISRLKFQNYLRNKNE